MMLIFLLQLINSFEGLSGAEHEMLCTSKACFTLNMDKESFKTANDSCHYNGGYLMTVRNRDEEDVLRSLLSQVQTQHQDKTLTFWIGLKLHRGDCVSTGKTLRGFKWISGKEDSHYSNWGKEPVATCTEERCAAIHYDPSLQNQLKWTAGPCKALAFYACKFYFQGMCRPLALLGPGEITYTLPFAQTPQRSQMQSLPLGTYAEISCGDEESLYTLCMRTGDVYHWKDPGPFCKTGKRSCAINNGGCEHLCHQDADEVKCSCKEGYDLGEDGLTCRIKDLCDVGICEHQCVIGESGYSCSCPDGFRLEENQRNCTDIDECQVEQCGEHACVNIPGTYTCVCKDGYENVDGRCSDLDECAQFRCEHGCLNSIGSFSCYCNEGFVLAEDGNSCVKTEECVNHQCRFQCTRTDGSSSCTCPQGFHTVGNDLICIPDVTNTVTASDHPAEEGTQENFNESLTRTSIELQHQPPHTDAPLSDLENVTHADRQSNTSLVTSSATTVNRKVLICVLGSVIPLLLLIAVTLTIAIVRCSRSKKEAKKNTTTDGYCWVASDLDPRLEKLYESILTDDL